MDVYPPEIAKESLEHGGPKDEERILEQRRVLPLHDRINPFLDEPRDRHPHEIGRHKSDDSEDQEAAVAID